LPLIAPGKKTIGGVRKRHGLSASLQVGAMFSSERGFSESGGMRWKYYHEGRQASRGKFLGTYLRDQGRDRSGLMMERKSRGWFYLAQQTELKERWRIDSEISYLSDRDYLLEFEERIAKTEKQQETYLYTHLREGPIIASALARWRINDFQDYTERLPELTLDGFSIPFFEDPILGGGSTFTFNFAGAHIRQRKDNFRRGDPTREINRVDGTVEVDHKVPLGPFIARGFARQRFTAVDRSPTRSGGTERLTGSAGANLATTIWRQFGDRSTHVIVPEIGYFNRYFNSRDPTDFFQIDEVDQVQETEFIFLRTRSRLSLLTEDKKRYFDFIDFAVETRYFPNANKDNNRRNFGSLFGDLRLYYPKIFRARVRVETDPSRGDIVTNESSINMFLSAFFKDDDPYIEALQNISVGASYRDLRRVTEALGWNVTWQISKKWSFRLDEQYDFMTSRFTQHRGTFRRRFHRFSLDFSVSVDPGEDDVTFSVQLAPDLFGSSSDPFQNGRLSGIGY
ncbi:MAG: LPS assembly protein LptD, partial [Planctomycetota bacterium]|nr:LPS assembly protein LptD [Planctomycetota bacterium]